VIDENAFGILISNHAIEDEEYGLDREAFVERVDLFRDTLRTFLRERSPGADVRAIDLGHALYVEIADGQESESPIAWAKAVRACLAELSFESVVGVTHGGRWVEDDDAGASWFSSEALGEVGLVRVSHPSEPFRRALYLDAAARAEEQGDGGEDDTDGDAEGSSGWGPGLYLDLEAVEALRIKLRNEPTRLRCAGAVFYRIGS
jgi:hypothetical protein